MSQSMTPTKRPTPFQSSIGGRSTAARSVSPINQKTVGDSVCYEIPMDPTNSFNISYLPGINGFDVDTGKTLEEARLKVVILTCEIERLTTYNYALVKENEILRVQTDKTAREQDLETKLAIVLAENEKLNFVIEELYEVFMAQGQDAQDREALEGKIAELMQDLDDSKSKYDLLEKNNRVELQNTANALKDNNDLLAQQLAMKDKDLETLRNRMGALENLLRENERLNDLVNQNLGEMKKLREENNQLNFDLQAKDMNLEKLQKSEQKKNATNREAQNRVQELLEANEKLQKAIDTLNDQLAKAAEENKKLVAQLNEKDRDYKALLEKLSNHIKQLLQENENLNRLALENSELSAKSASLDGENRKLRANLEQADELNNDLSAKLKDAGQMLNGMEDYKQKILMLVEENNRLNNLLKLKVDELEALRIKLQGAEAMIERFEELSEKLQLLALEYQRLENEKMRLEAALAEAEREIARLNDLLMAMRGENEEWKRKYAELQAVKDNEEELDELRKQFAAIKKMAMDAREEQQKFSAERMAYETQIWQLNQRNNDLENQGALLVGENDRLSNLNAERVKNIEDLKRESNYDAQKLEILELKNQLELVKSSAYDVRQALTQAQNDRDAQQRKVADLVMHNEALAADVAQLQQFGELRRADTESLARQNEELRALCDKLSKQNNSDNTGVGNEILELKDAKIEELEKSRDEYRRQAERNANDVTRKNRELVEKIQELDVVKLRYEEAMANYQALNNQVFTRMSTPGRNF